VLYSVRTCSFSFDLSNPTNVKLPISGIKIYVQYIHRESITAPSSVPSYLVGNPHIFETGGSILTLPCSQRANTSPSLSLLIVPLKTHILLPALTTSLSTSTFSPTGTGFRYVTLNPLLTPAYCQYPGLAIGASAVVVQMSKTVAVHPPWRFPRRLQCEGRTVKRNTVRPAGEAVAETKSRESWKKVEPQPCSIVRK
jgi:hypothetical protein